ncbi:MAG: glycerol-3-phosphate dehydrogenase [Clostridia bacterium]|nr:glycerol-3-phosphate dehydrogenase [Clostridia bacterium]
MKFSLLGPGRWGSFIAWYLDKIGHDVTVWGLKESESFNRLLTTHKNEYVEFPSSIKMTSNLQEAIDRSDFIVISIGAQGLRSFSKTLAKQANYKSKKYILCMKGIEEKTGNRLSTILIDAGINPKNIAVWVGPGHIQSFVNGVASVMIIDSYNPKLSLKLTKILRSDLIRFYQGEDIIGSEIGAAAKNVMGIAAGLLDGMGFSTLKGGLMARGSREIARLIKACGGNELSAYGLCHLGDYEATLFSKYSHNRMWGEKFAKDEPFDKLAEGVATSAALLKLAKRVKVDLPITKTVYNVIHNKISKKEAIKQLFKRKTIHEFE